MPLCIALLLGESVETRGSTSRTTWESLKLFAAMLGTMSKTSFFLQHLCHLRNTTVRPLTEDHPQLPINPYGESKLILERRLRATKSLLLAVVFLRYFNAAGASLDGRLGESHDPESHLIPLVLHSCRVTFELTYLEKIIPRLMEHHS